MKQSSSRSPSALTPNTVKLIPALGTLPPPMRAHPGPGPRSCGAGSDLVEIVLGEDVVGAVVGGDEDRGELHHDLHRAPRHRTLPHGI